MHHLWFMSGGFMNWQINQTDKKEGRGRTNRRRRDFTKWEE
jgi:hypothetical protein